MPKSLRVECRFCFHRVKFTPRSLDDLITCKRCGQTIDWHTQVEDTVLSMLTANSHPAHIDPLSLSTSNSGTGNFGATLQDMPWQVRLIAVMHAILMFYKVTSLLTSLITNKIKGPTHLIIELAMISFAFWTFYGIHYRSRATWLTLKNFSKFNMYLLTILGISFSIIFMVKRPQILFAFFPIWSFIWLFFSIDYLLLKTKAARNYFHVICPNCKSQDTKAADTSFKIVRCKKCQKVWS